jgi:hypothetical protein
MHPPSPVQQEFLSCRIDEVLFGGAAGPGKTETLLDDPLQILQQEHDRYLGAKQYRSECRMLHLRRTFPQLAENIDRFHGKLMDVYGGRKFKWDGDSHTFTMPSGAKFVFGHMKDSDSYKQYIGTQWVRVYWDELTQFEKHQYDWVFTRVRASDPLLRQWCGMRAASNPEAGWVRDHFVKPAPDGRVILERRLKMSDGSTETKSRIYIPARLADHPDPEFRKDYESRLRLQPKHIADALINGNWWVSAGSFYADSFDPAVHVCKPFKIPQTWPCFRACDWGFATKGVILWAAIDPNDTIYVWKEFVFSHLDWTQVVDEVRDVEIRNKLWHIRRNTSLICGPLDTQAWEERGHIGPSMAVGMMSRGVPWIKANKGRRLAAQEIVRRLRHRNKDGSPGLVIFDTCKDLLDTFPQIQVDETDKEAPKKGGDDHAYDTLSYLLMARYTYKSLAPAVEDDDDDREDHKSRLYDNRGRMIA